MIRNGGFVELGFIFSEDLYGIFLFGIIFGYELSYLYLL